MRKHVFIGFAAAVLIFSGSSVPAHADSRLSISETGSGPDVILIPGLASSAAVWDATVKHLAAHYRVHVVQVEGFAGTPAGDNAQGPVIEPCLEALDAYIKAQGLKAPAVIGHSLGGMMGLELAERHPEDVGKLMIVDSLPFAGAMMGAADTKAVEPIAAQLRGKIIGESQADYEAGEAQYLARLVKSPEGRKIATGWADASDKQVVAEAMYDDMTTDLRPALAAVQIPVTVLYPWDASGPLPFTQAQSDGFYAANYAALPHKTLKRVDGSYHFIMLDQPAAFQDAVDAFLK